MTRTHQVGAHQAPGFFAGIASADLELPFMLSSWAAEDTSVGEDPEATGAFSEMLMDLLKEEDAAAAGAGAAATAPTASPATAAAAAAAAPQPAGFSMPPPNSPAWPAAAAATTAAAQPAGLPMQPPPAPNGTAAWPPAPELLQETPLTGPPPNTLHAPVPVETGTATHLTPSRHMSPPQQQVYHHQSPPPHHITTVVIHHRKSSAGQQAGDVAGAPYAQQQQGGGGRGPRSASTSLSGSVSQSQGEGGGEDGKGDIKARRRAAVQKRYREKKEGSIHVLQEEANRKLAALAALEQEHAALLGRQSTLEKLVQCRDEQLVVLARARGMCRQDMTPGAALHPSESCCFGEVDCAAPVQLGGPDELAAYKNMTVPDLITRWRSFVTSASQLLAQMPATLIWTPMAAGPTGHQLHALVSEVGVMMKRVIQLNCAVLYAVMQTNLDTGVPGIPPDSHYQGVLHAMALSPAQQMEAAAMFDLYVQLMQKVHEERRELKEGLAALTGVSHAPPGYSGAQLPDYLMPPGACCASEMSYAEQLLLSLHKERSTRCLLCCFFFGKLLTPPQLAQAAVAAHPFFPDPLALSRLLAGARQCKPTI